jgi:hypothetical protein
MEEERLQNNMLHCSQYKEDEEGGGGVGGSDDYEARGDYDCEE